MSFGKGLNTIHSINHFNNIFKWLNSSSLRATKTHNCVVSVKAGSDDATGQHCGKRRRC